MKNELMIRQMTLSEKCALLTGQDVWHTRGIPRLGIPPLTLSDGPSGLRRQAAQGDHLGLNPSQRATCYPSASTLANSWDPALLEAVGQRIGGEARAQGVQVVLGPGLNTKRSPLCGRNFEYYSEDPYLSGKLAAAFIKGVQTQGVAACPKHFAANSQEFHRMCNDSVVDERTLRELYLTNFEIAVKEGNPQAIMTAYNQVNGVYANESPYLLEEILGKGWGFKGAVITDWGGSNDFVAGVGAGCTLEMPGTGEDSACQLLAAVQSGQIPEALVDERVDSLLTLIFSLPGPEAAIPPASQAEGHRLAREAAEQSIVLLKNDGPILPLDSQARVAIIGDFARSPRYQGSGSSAVNPTQVSCPLDILTDCFPRMVGFERGFTRQDQPDEALVSSAAALAREAECVLLYLGLPEAMECEGLDRSHLRIPANQIRLLEAVSAANPQVIVIFSGGSGVEMPWLDRCQALLWAGLGGQAGAEALPRILTGAACPGGKLAETFPLTYEDLPVSRYYPGKQRTSEYREGLYVGYRYTESAGVPVRFPFGFGLSYTRFAYENLIVEADRVSFDLTNTGDRAGAEIAQLYISLPKSRIFRPAKELKGFQKVGLAPGETKRVTLCLDDKAFRYFNSLTRRFEVEPGRYRLLIGASAADIRLAGELAVAGSSAPLPYEGLAVDCYWRAAADPVTNAQFRVLLGRELPPAGPADPTLLEMNDPVDQLFRARNPLARWIGRLIKGRVEKSLAAGKPDLNLLFIYNLPFRGIAKMMNGQVSLAMAQSLLLMINGHFFKGAGRLLRGCFTRPRLPKKPLIEGENAHGHGASKGMA